MAKLSRKNGITSVILRVKLLDSASTVGAGKTGLDHTSAGLIIATLASNEAATTRYRASSSELETITTLGTFAAPTSGKARFKEVDATNHPGLYEIQLADARWAVLSARALIVSLSGASGMAQVDMEVDLAAQVDTTHVNGTAQTAGDLAALINTVDDFLDTEVAAIKAKTDNLSSDPADASDIAALLASIAGYIDTEVAAIKAKTDNLPSDPADASVIAGLIAALPTISTITNVLYQLNDCILAKGSITTVNTQIEFEVSGISDLDGLDLVGHLVFFGDSFQSGVWRTITGFSGGTLTIDTDFAGAAPGITVMVVSSLELIKVKTDNLPSDPADASVIAGLISGLASTLATIATYVDTEVAAIKAKTDNLPSDPADASDIATATTAIAGYIDTEVAAIKAKTDNLPSDPADQSVLAGLIAALPSLNAIGQRMIDNNECILARGSITTVNTQLEFVVTGISDLDGLDLVGHHVFFGENFQTGVWRLVTGFSAGTLTIDTDYAGAPGTSVTIISSIELITAKTNNLPSDPADASVVAGLIASVATSLATLATYVDTEVAAIKAKTDNLPSDPADQSLIMAAIAAIEGGEGGGGASGGGILSARVAISSLAPRKGYMEIVQGEEKVITLIVEADGRFDNQTADAITVKFADPDDNLITIENDDVERITEELDVQVVRVTLTPEHTETLTGGLLRMEIAFDLQKAALRHSIKVIEAL